MDEMFLPMTSYSMEDDAITSMTSDSKKSHTICKLQLKLLQVGCLRTQWPHPGKRVSLGRRLFCMVNSIAIGLSRNMEEVLTFLAVVQSSPVQRKLQSHCISRQTWLCVCIYASLALSLSHTHIQIHIHCIYGHYRYGQHPPSS